MQLQRRVSEENCRWSVRSKCDGFGKLDVANLQHLIRSYQQHGDAVTHFDNLRLIYDRKALQSAILRFLLHKHFGSAHHSITHRDFDNASSDGLDNTRDRTTENGWVLNGIIASFATFVSAGWMPPARTLTRISPSPGSAISASRTMI